MKMMTTTSSGYWLCSRIKQISLITALLLLYALILKVERSTSPTTSADTTGNLENNNNSNSNKKRVFLWNRGKQQRQPQQPQQFADTCPAPLLATFTHPNKDSNNKLETLATARASRLSNVVEGPGLEEWHDDAVTQALCKFRTSPDTPKHFPHMLQQLYRCFAWWHANPHKQSVLIAPPITTNLFVTGFLAVLQDVFQVQFRQQRPAGAKAVRPRVHFDFDENHQEDHHPLAAFKMRSPADFAYMRDALLARYPIPDSVGGCRPLTNTEKSQPVITILNRAEHSGRHLFDVAALQTALQHELQLLPSENINHVELMDGKTFGEQVAVMQSTDILISPHGAQLVSIPFLPPCAHVLEIFSPHYFAPRFYSTLTNFAGHDYHYLYTGGMDPAAVVQQDTLEQRRISRAEQICLTTQTIQEQIVPAVRQMIQQWKACCQRQKLQS